MTQIMKPGLKFTATCIEPMYPTTGLHATMSSYSYGSALEGCPTTNDVYIICQDGSIQSVLDPKRPIGWELIEDGNEWFYRVTQMNHTPKKCAVFYRGHDENPPTGHGFIGSQVFVCRRIIEEPQCAEITEASDSSDEISSH
jgi:hypothetical protein